MNDLGVVVISFFVLLFLCLLYILCYTVCIMVFCRCAHPLGPINNFLVPMHCHLLPPAPMNISYITFECLFSNSYGFKILGEGPVVVTGISGIGNSDQMVMEGRVLEECGPNANCIIRGFLPTIGDVVVSVDGDIVTQLDYQQVRSCAL